MIELIPSPRESARFGVRVARAHVNAVDLHELISVLQRAPIDVVILRLPESAIEALHDLKRHGFVPTVADTLVRYEIDLRARPAAADRRDVLLRPATSADACLLESMAREIFAGYISHYHANPLFPPNKILDGYAEWAASHVEPTNESTGAWIVERSGCIVGFSCYELDAKGDLATGVLNGIMPGARNQGSYSAMLRCMLDHFAELGMRRFSIATQDHNIAVQRTWTREGLTLCEVSHTVHINTLRAMEGAFIDAGVRRTDLSR